MNQSDLLILVVYTITVILVLKRAIGSVEQVTAIAVDSSAMQEALEEHDLADKLKITFPVPDRTPLGEQPKTITVMVENQLERDVSVEWHRSSFIALDWDEKSESYLRRSRRVVHLGPYRGGEIISAQAVSSIPPGETIEEKITVEDTLVRDGDTVAPQKPLVGIKKLSVGESITFSLWLAIYLSETDDADDRRYILPCDFKVTRCPWTDSLPF